MKNEIKDVGRKIEMLRELYYRGFDDRDRKKYDLRPAGGRYGPRIENRAANYIPEMGSYQANGFWIEVYCDDPDDMKFTVALCREDEEICFKVSGIGFMYVKEMTRQFWSASTRLFYTRLPKDHDKMLQDSSIQKEADLMWKKYYEMIPHEENNSLMTTPVEEICSVMMTEDKSLIAKANRLHRWIFGEKGASDAVKKQSKKA